MISLICLFLFGLLEVSNLYLHHELVHYASSCGARSVTVGLDDLMVRKSMYVALLPISGVSLTRNAGSDMWDYALANRAESSAAEDELKVIPVYLDSDSGYATGVLNYDEWANLDTAIVADLASDLVHTKIEKTETLRHAFSRWIFGVTKINFGDDSYYQIENHAGLYLE